MDHSSLCIRFGEILFYLKWKIPGIFISSYTVKVYQHFTDTLQKILISVIKQTENVIVMV